MKLPKKHALPALCVTVLCFNLFAARASAEKLLPLKRVRLYEVGVGYFERGGAVRDKSDLTLALPQSQLDDALDSLVILGGSSAKSRIFEIEFESRESPDLARAEAALTEDASAPLEFARVLRSFRGIEIEVRDREHLVRGRLVDVISLAHASAEQCSVETSRANAPASPAPTSAPCSESRDANLVVLAADGTLSRVALHGVSSVRALDQSVAAELSRALDAATARKSARGREILRVHGSGSTELTLGYVAEAPVWRSSYRLVLDDASHSAKLQGFALIHNDTGEAWRGVKLELVNGRPSSFLYPMAAPRYARRALVTPDEPLSTVPQLLTRTADDEWEPDVGDSIAESYGAAGLGLSGAGEGGGGRGEGIGLGSVGTVGHGAGSGSSNAFDVGNLTNLGTASGVEGAAQFSYALDSPIDLGPHASALVPFVDEAITLTRVTWFGDDDDGETGARLVNSSAQTLPGGVLSVFSDGGFSGSTLLPRTKPGETRVLRFGRDLDVTLRRNTRLEGSEPMHYSYEASELREHDLRRSKIFCELENKSKTARTVSVALTIVANARVSGADELTYDSALGRAIASFQLPAGAKLTRTLEVSEGITTPIPRAQLSSDFLQRAANTPSLDAKQRASLRAASNAMYQVEIRRGALPKRKSEIDEALADSARLESHVRALGPNSDEGRLAAARLRKIEDRVTELRARVHALESEMADYDSRVWTALATLG